MNYYAGTKNKNDYFKRNIKSSFKLAYGKIYNTNTNRVGAMLQKKLVFLIGLAVNNRCKVVSH